MKIFDKISLYLRANNINRAQKNKEERIKSILTLINQDKSPQEKIKTIRTVKGLFNKQLTEYKEQQDKEFIKESHRVNKESEYIDTFLSECL